jgi:hypothetical protein
VTLPSPSPRLRRRSRPARAWTLRCGSAQPCTLDLDLRRGSDGLWELDGRSTPAGAHAEAEVRAGWSRLVVALDSDGRFRIAGLPGDARHFKLTLRGGSAPAIVLPGVPTLERSLD